MITKLLIPIVDLSRANFDYGRNISVEEAADMEYNKFRKTDRQIGNYVNSMQYRTSGWGSQVHDVRGIRRDFSNVIDDDEYIECEAYVTDSKKNDVDERFFTEREPDKKFIIIININPNSIEMEGESEIRYWRDDSNGVLNDSALDNQTKIERLMERDLGIELRGERYRLERCKIISDISSRDFPYYYAILVNKISKF